MLIGSAVVLHAFAQFMHVAYDITVWDTLLGILIYTMSIDVYMSAAISLSWLGLILYSITGADIRHVYRSRGVFVEAYAGPVPLVLLDHFPDPNLQNFGFNESSSLLLSFRKTAVTLISPVKSSSESLKICDVNFNTIKSTSSLSSLMNNINNNGSAGGAPSALR
ncbi:hypothetical protein ACH5RR_037789 [Cinchona calisaya]|uniref:Uncharacterized protein n=1 Tax=Cinchona calisaya TaxID=153742 RepID=A0ABD2YAV5_9GENT